MPLRHPEPVKGPSFDKLRMTEWKLRMTEWKLGMTEWKLGMTEWKLR
jgi:hypothetical protein